MLYPTILDDVGPTCWLSLNRPLVIKSLHVNFGINCPRFYPSYLYKITRGALDIVSGRIIWILDNSFFLKFAKFPSIQIYK